MQRTALAKLFELAVGPQLTTGVSTSFSTSPSKNSNDLDPFLLYLSSSQVNLSGNTAIDVRILAEALDNKGRNRGGFGGRDLVP